MILNLKKYIDAYNKIIYYFKGAFIILLFKALNDGEDNGVDFDYKIETASIFCNISRI
jgi:hypothetical protein